MTQEQYQWLKDNGYDPAVYDVDEQGNIFENPVSAPATQKKMSPLRAAGTSFLGNLLPTAGGLGASAPLVGLAAANPLVGIPLMIGAGMLGGYGTGKLQEAALEKFAPEAQRELARAQTEQPVASYLGGFAPNALAFRPSLQGMSGLLRPTARSEETLRAALTNPNFVAPAANIAANVGASTAGQLVDMAQGGEFSGPRFAADVALGTLFNRPTALGRAAGFQDLPQGRPVERPELAPAREQAEFMAYPPSEFSTPREERLGIGRELEGREQFFTPEGERMTEKAMAKDYTNWWKSETEPTVDLLKGAAEEVKMKLPREKLKELSNDPEVGEVLRDPSKMEAFVAKGADQALEDVFQMMERRRSREFATAEEAANQKAFRALQAERGVPTETPLSDVEAAYEARQRTPEGEAQNLYGPELAGPAAPKPPSPSKAASGYDLMQPQVKQNATDAAREVYTRLQRPEGAGENRITQQDIDFAAEIAARRGLKIELDRAFTEGGQEVRGMYFVDKKTGNRIIRVNPLMATPDTAIHEIGHDIFTGVTNKGMRRSLLDTALDSPAYKSELAARLKEGMPEAQARDFALEEGLIQAFGEKMPEINRGELRSWFRAFKASMKQLFTGKLSPEDALAWMHYATTEAVPWKGAVVGKGGEERLQRGENENYLKAVQDFREGYQKRIARGMSHENAIKAAASDTEEYVGELGIFEPSNKGVQIDQQAWLNQVFEADAKNWEPAYSKAYGKTYAEYFVPGRDSIFHDLSGLTWDKQSPTADFPNLAQAIDYVSGDPAKLTNLVGEDSALKLLAAYQKSLPKTGKLNVAAAERLLQESSDIRYQRGLLSKIQTPSELDYLVSKGGPFAEVGTTIKAAANTRDFKQGQWSSKFSLTTALPEEARVRLLNHLAGEFDSGVLKAPAPDLKAAYDQLRKEYLPAIVNDYNTAGFMVRDTAGLRARGSNPTYFPLHAIADAVKDVLTTKQGSPEWDKLKADFINWNTQLRQADGASLAEAQRYANEKFEEKLSITAKPPGIESGIPFSGARKPEGYPLPPSWRSNDILDILNNYTRRSATDFAYQQHVESSPVAMAALGAKTMVNNQPIPANILQSTAPVINDPSVQSVLREYRGTPAQKTEGALQSIGRFVGAATLGPVSKTGDIGTSMFKGLAYLPGSEYADGLATFTNKIADWAALKERSYASGLNKRDAAENMRQVLGIAEDSTAFMDKAARAISKATFVNDLESVARVIAQGWGETIVGINKKLALGGDNNATQMLDTLTPDWRTRSDADLAAQVGRLLQGSYDMRQLPASFLEGAAAPYLTWSKWSMGQYDSFMKYALQPAMQGNMKPLIGQMVIGLLGGGAISAVQEWLNNREGKDITWRELESWMQQNQGELGADGGVLLGQKLLTMAQKMGTFGFAGDLSKMVVDALAGGTAQGVATMPAMDAIYDTTKRAAAALKALDDGEDFGLVAKALMQDSLTGHVQVVRVARNWLDTDENLRYDDRRRQRLYDELMGLPSKGGAFTVNYSNLSEREFERGEITPETGEEALALVTRAREEATSREDYASRIRKLKTSQNAIMPSLDRQPMKAARYLSWLEGAEEGAGAETMKRYMIREQEDKYRKSLIEGLSGLR
jgi:hypothetical protein